jgi:hypothetical protein
MQDTIATTEEQGLAALVDLVAAADAADELLVSSARLVDALLDVRNEVPETMVAVVDAGLAACSHRHVVPTAEAVELVATITAGQALRPDPV